MHNIFQVLFPVASLIFFYLLDSVRICKWNSLSFPFSTLISLCWFARPSHSFIDRLSLFSCFFSVCEKTIPGWKIPLNFSLLSLQKEKNNLLSIQWVVVGRVWSGWRPEKTEKTEKLKIGGSCDDEGSWLGRPAKRNDKGADWKLKNRWSLLKFDFSLPSPAFAHPPLSIPQKKSKGKVNFSRGDHRRKICSLFCGVSKFSFSSTISIRFFASFLWCLFFSLRLWPNPPLALLFLLPLYYPRA